MHSWEITKRSRHSASFKLVLRDELVTSELTVMALSAGVLKRLNAGDKVVAPILVLAPALAKL